MDHPQIFLDEFREEVENLYALRKSVITMKNQIDNAVMKSLINICINGDGSLNYSDIPEMTSSKTATGHYKLIHNLDKLPLIVFICILNPEYLLTSYQITSINENEISFITFKWSDGNPINSEKIYILLK